MMEATDKYKILIVDDHPVFCLGMTELINKEDDLLVCGSIENLRDADSAIRKLQPDMVIVDIGLKDGNGLKLVEDIRQKYKTIKTLVLSMYDESLYAERAFLAGALGYVMKQEAISSVVKAIRLVRNNNVYASAQVKEKIFKRLTSHSEQEKLSPLAVLTNRELEVFRLIGKGFSSREISEQLHLSIKTIGTYRENIKEKLQIKHFTELVRVAVHWTQHMEF